MENINPNATYTEDEARKLMGGIGKSKLYEYRKLGLINPFRTKPSYYLGQEILDALKRITTWIAEGNEDAPEDYGIED